ncbi:unnamed protein product [Pedinophyceae sp. YPF-701]|nr:unnamed protein product [Pedinophyceae sp. YPF-701]
MRQLTKSQSLMTLRGAGGLDEKLSALDDILQTGDSDDVDLALAHTYHGDATASVPHSPAAASDSAHTPASTRRLEAQPSIRRAELEARKRHFLANERPVLATEYAKRFGDSDSVPPLRLGLVVVDADGRKIGTAAPGRLAGTTSARLLNIELPEDGAESPRPKESPKPAQDHAKASLRLFTRSNRHLNSFR